MSQRRLESVWEDWMCQKSEFQRASSRGCVEKAGGVDLSRNFTVGKIVPRGIARLERLQEGAAQYQGEMSL